MHYWKTQNIYVNKMQPQITHLTVTIAVLTCQSIVCTLHFGWNTSTSWIILSKLFVKRGKKYKTVAFLKNTKYIESTHCTK